MTRRTLLTTLLIVSLATVCTHRLTTPATGQQTKKTIRFSDHLIKDKFGYTFGVEAVDIDGDGDLDLTSPDIIDKSISKLYWFENDGKGNFTKQLIFDGEPGWFERHFIADINKDGLPDVAIINNKTGVVIWLENSKTPKKPWKRHLIAKDCPKAYDIVMADLDGDGDLDAATNNYVGARFFWFENPGIGKSGPWKKTQIDYLKAEVRTLVTADVNRDGKPDLIGTAIGNRGANESNHGSKVIWYENTGSKTKRFRRHIIDDTLPGATHGSPVDLDKDGDVDVVMAHGMRLDIDRKVARHQVVWYEQISRPKSAPKWKRHLIGKMPFAFEAVGADMDRDGDIDVVASAWSKGDRIVWFENLGKGKWTKHVVKTGFRAANQVIVADLNGDKWPDIVAASDDGSRRVKGSLELRWFKNLGR